MGLGERELEREAGRVRTWKAEENDPGEEARDLAEVCGRAFMGRRLETGQVQGIGRWWDNKVGVDKLTYPTKMWIGRTDAGSHYVPV